MIANHSFEKQKYNQFTDEQFPDSKQPQAKSKFQRGFDKLMAFSYSFNYIGSIPSLLSYINYGLGTGGPTTMIWGFIFTSIMTILVSLSLAEICSAFPLNGSVYNWSRKLSKEKYAKETSFHVGWLYTFGSIAGMSTNNLASAMVLSQLIQIYFPDYQINNIDKIIFSNFINLLSTGVNLLKIEQQGRVNNFIAAQGIISSIIISIILVFFAPVLVYIQIKATSDFVFYKFYNTTNIPNSFYVSNVGIMMSLYCISGYDSAGQMGEETKNPSVNAPKGIINSVVISCISTFIFLLVTLYNIGGESDHYLNQLVNSQNLYFDIFKKQFSSKPLVFFLTLNIFLLVFLNGISSMSGQSRIVHSMCRDKCLPYSEYFSKLDDHTNIPKRILIFLFVTQIFFNIWILFSPMAYDVFGDLNTCCWQLAYLIIISIRLINYDCISFGNSQYSLGNVFILGKYSKLINIITLIFLLYTSVIMLLPNQLSSQSQMNWDNFNFSPIALFTCFLLGYGYFKIYGIKQMQFFQDDIQI